MAAEVVGGNIGGAVREPSPGMLAGRQPIAAVDGRAKDQVYKPWLQSSWELAGRLVQAGHHISPPRSGQPAVDGRRSDGECGAIVRQVLATSKAESGRPVCHCEPAPAGIATRRVAAISLLRRRHLDEYPRLRGPCATRSGHGRPRAVTCDPADRRRSGVARKTHLCCLQRAASQ